MIQTTSFRPKFFTSIRHYSKSLFVSDLMVGAIVGIVALPLAIASGVSPEKGIITAVIAGFVISFLRGSKVQIGGPTGAFIAIVYGIVQEYGFHGLAIATFMAGVLLILTGVFRLGTVIKFIPYPIIVGFTAGIAMTIFTTQMADVLGLDLAGEEVPGDFIGKWMVYVRHMDSINGWNVLTILLSIGIILLTPRLLRKIPGSLMAILIVTLVVWVLGNYCGITGIDTIGTRLTLVSSLPEVAIPSIDWKAIQELFPIAVTIAILGAIESLLSAQVADGLIGDRHHSNTELIALGVANMCTPLFGGIPAAGAIARTMTNINNGGHTPVAGIVHSVVLLLILLLLMPLAQYIPMACLAGVLVVVSYNMSGWRSFRELLKGSKPDVAVLLITFFLTVIFDLTIAIEMGLLIACVSFIGHVMKTTEISIIKDEIKPCEETIAVPDGVEVYEINGPYFLGIATQFEEVMAELGDKPLVRIIRMRRVPFIDSTGVNNLSSLCRMSHKEGIRIVLSGVNENVHATLHNSGFYSLLNEENICPHINAALKRAQNIINSEQ